jgi:hypothetical protein
MNRHMSAAVVALAVLAGCADTGQDPDTSYEEERRAWWAEQRHAEQQRRESNPARAPSTDARGDTTDASETDTRALRAYCQRYPADRRCHGNPPDASSQ